MGRSSPRGRNEHVIDHRVPDIASAEVQCCGFAMTQVHDMQTGWFEVRVGAARPMSTRDRGYSWVLTVQGWSCVRVGALEFVAPLHLHRLGVRRRRLQLRLGLGLQHRLGLRLRRPACQPTTNYVRSANRLVDTSRMLSVVEVCDLGCCFYLLARRSPSNTNQSLERQNNAAGRALGCSMRDPVRRADLRGWR